MLLSRVSRDPTRPPWQTRPHLQAPARRPTRARMPRRRCRHVMYRPPSPAGSSTFARAHRAAQAWHHKRDFDRAFAEAAEARDDRTGKKAAATRSAGMVYRPGSSAGSSTFDAVKHRRRCFTRRRSRCPRLRWMRACRVLTTSHPSASRCTSVTYFDRAFAEARDDRTCKKANPCENGCRDEECRHGVPPGVVGRVLHLRRGEAPPWRCFTRRRSRCPRLRWMRACRVLCGDAECRHGVMYRPPSSGPAHVPGECEHAACRVNYRALTGAHVSGEWMRACRALTFTTSRQSASRCTSVTSTERRRQEATAARRPSARTARRRRRRPTTAKKRVKKRAKNSLLKNDWREREKLMLPPRRSVSNIAKHSSSRPTQN